MAAGCMVLHFANTIYRAITTGFAQRLAVAGLFIVSMLTPLASHAVDDIRIDNEFNQQLLRFRIVEVHRDDRTDGRASPRNGIQVLRQGRSLDDSSLIVHAFNPPPLSPSASIISLMDATQRRVVDDDGIDGTLKVFTVYDDHAAGQRGVVAALLRNDTLFAARTLPGRDSVVLVYLCHGEDIDGSGAWECPAEVCLTADYDHDGKDEVVLQSMPERDRRPRTMFCFEPQTLTVEWALPVAGAVSWRNTYPAGDSANPEIIFASYNYKNGVEDEYFDDNLCYLARVDRHGNPVYRAILSEQHGGRGLWKSSRPDRFLVFHALPMLPVERKDSLPDEVYQLSLIDGLCRVQHRVDVPNRVVGAWTGDYNGDGADDWYTVSSNGAVHVYDSALAILAECRHSNLMQYITSLRLPGESDLSFVFLSADGMRVLSRRLELQAHADFPVARAHALVVDSGGHTLRMIVNHRGHSHVVDFSRQTLTEYVGALFWVYRDFFLISACILVLALVVVNARRQIAIRRMLASERQLHSVFENAPDGFYRTDLEGRLIWASPSAADLLGVDTADDVIGRRLTDFYVYPEKRAELLKLLQERGRVTDYEVLLRRGDSSIITVSTNSYLCRDDKGEVMGVEGVARDISDRKQAEQALADSEERYRSLLANLPVGIYRSKPDGTLLSVSPGMLKMYGFATEKEMLSRNAEQYYDDPSVRQEILKKFETTSTILDFETRMRRSDGSVLWVSSSMFATHREDGTIDYFDGIDTDITQRKEAEQALRQSEEKYRLLVENVQAAISLVSYDGVFLFANEVAASATGRPSEQLIGATQWEVFPQETADRHMLEIRRVIDTGNEQRNETEVPLKIGRRTFFTNLQPYRDETGRITAALVIAYDVTELRQAENQLSRLGRAVERSIDGIAVCNNDYCYEYVNDAWASMHGMRPADLIGKHIRTNHTSEQYENEVLPFKKRVESSGSGEGEVMHVTADGLVFPAYMTVTLLQDESGRPRGMVSIARDITEMKRTLAALKESEDRFRSIAEYSLQGIYVIEDGRFVFVNKRFADMLDRSVEDILAMSPEDVVREHIVDEESVRRRLDSYERRLAGEDVVVHEELHGSTASGEERWVETLSHTFVLQGKLILQGVVADITERRLAEEALRASESRYRQLVEGAGEAIFTVDRQGRMLFANSIAASIMGATSDSVIGREVWPSIAPDEVAHAREVLERRFTHGTSDLVEYGIVVGDQTRIFRSTLQPLVDDSGNTTAVLAIARDVTESIQTQRELTRERDFIRSLLDTANSLIVGLDREARVIVFNRESEKVTGYSREEVLGEHRPEFFAPPVAETRTGFAEWLARQHHDVCEGTVITRSGDTRTILWSTSTLPSSGPNDLTAIAVGQDITERKQAEEALRSSEEFSRVILERSPLGISVRSRSGKLLSYNEAWRRIWRVWDDDLLDYTTRERQTLEFDHRDSYLGEWLPKVREVYEQGGYLHVPELDLSMSRKGGERWLSQYFYAIRDPRGEVDRVVIITEDITKRKQAEAEAQQASQAKYEQAKHIAGGFAHEIRNALFPAEGALYRLRELVEACDDGHNAPRYITSAAESVVRAIDITEMISTYTKLESQRLNEAVDLRKTVTDVLEANRLRIEDQKVDVGIEGLERTMVAGNRQQLYSVINNILLNSLDALTDRPQPRILLTVVRDHKTITLSLRDNGHGIPQKDLGRVFDTFFSSKPSKGTGLGLATAKKIVEMYNGRIAVSSELGRWTQVDVALCISEEPADNEDSLRGDNSRL